jgi:hypothetical protein
MKKFSVMFIVVVAMMCLYAVPLFADVSAEATVEDVNANASNDLTINYPASKDVTRSMAKGYRGFTGQGEINYPGMPGYFGSPTNGSSFQDVEVGLTYKNMFTEDELKKLAKSCFGSKVIVTPLVSKVDSKDKADLMEVMLKKPTNIEVEIVGYITVKATGKNTVSMEILAEAALAARDLGANVIHVTAQGVERELKSFGWGIGLVYTQSHISDSEQSGGVGTGGTGISGGSARYVDMPWFQVFALRVK